MSPGFVVDHPIGRTVTQTDNMFATFTSLNTAQPHFNLPYAQTFFDGRFSERLVVGSCVLAIAIGLSSTGWPGLVVERELGLLTLSFPAPVFPGDTVHARSTVASIEKDDADSQVVVSSLELFRSDEVVVLKATRRLRLVTAPSV